MLAAGSALAISPSVGNTLRGPGVDTTGTAAVTIDQIGDGNVTSKNGSADSASNDAVVRAGSGALNLAIQQVGNGNKLGLASYTAGVTNIGVYQGSAGGPIVGVQGNTAGVSVGSALAAAGDTTLLITQQSNDNTANANLGTSGSFTGTVNIVQMGGSQNNVAVTASGTSNAQQFNIGQNGNSNSLTVTAGAVTGPVNINFGYVTTFAAQPVAGSASNDSISSIALGASAGFNVSVAGNNNYVNTGMGNAYSYVDGLQLAGGYTSAWIYDNGGILKIANLSVNNSGGLDVFSATGSEVAVYGGASSLNTRGVADARSSTTVGTAKKMNVYQGYLVGAGSSAIIGLNGSTGSSWQVNQNDSGVQTFQMDNYTNNAVVNVTQAGDVSQTATGIAFAAASGSTFTLNQR